MIRSKEAADVCLITEGAYPFQTGGLAGWAHQLIEGLPDLAFDVVTLVAGSEPRIPRYELPGNVRNLHTLDIHGAPREALLQHRGIRALAAMRGRRAWETATADLVREFLESSAADRPAALGPLLDHLVRAGSRKHDFMHSREAWELVVASYRRFAAYLSFPDYYWTCRSLLVPFLGVLSAELPPATVYHAASTGHAGLLAALAARRAGSRMILTEHGIYSRERDVDLARADWVYVEPGQASALTPRRFFFREWWGDYFDLLAKVTYQHSDLILTLSDVNRTIQVRAGADPDLIRRVPNGVAISKFAGLRREHDWRDKPFRVGFIGRVVPVKDVKTFLRALALARLEIPNLEAFVVGPHDEAPEYARECRDLAMDLGLGDVLRFTGPAEVRDHLGNLDAVILTSLTESQPLAVLEANAAGVPCVCTDVGGCRELLEGSGDPADRALGPSGIVTRAARPAETAQAIVDLWRDPALHARLREAAIERVSRFYAESQLLESYMSIYAGLDPAPEGPAARSRGATGQNGVLK